MKISSFKIHPIAIADPPLRSSYGRHAPFALRTIVELKSDDGITGVSETYGGDRPVAALEAVRERVIGRNPFHLAGLYEELNRESRQASGRPESNLPGAWGKSARSE